MNYLIPKVSDNLLTKTQGFISQESLLEMQQKESAALAMCGGLLGNCYLLAEVTEYMVTNAVADFKKEPWYKQEIKKTFKSAIDALHTTIYSSVDNSPTNPEYMREVADAIYEELKPDLFKLTNAILLELNKLKIKHSSIIAEIITIDIMLRYITIEYDDVLKYMNTVYKAFYDSWYHPARCEGPAYWWNKGMQLVGKKFIPEELDLNNNSTIQNGITIIQKKIHSPEVAEIAKAEASKWAEDGGGRKLFEDSLNILGVNK